MRRILIADEHPLPRSALADLVRATLGDVEVGQVDTVHEALDAIAREPLDLLMCGSSTGAARGGDWVGELVRSVQPGKVVVVAARLNPRTCEETFRAGAWGHLPLTSSPELLAAAIRLIVAGGTYFPAVHPMVLRDERLMDAAPESVALSQRQQQVLREIERGLTNKEIAGKLGISVPTVKLHVQAILRAVGVKNRTGAAHWAREHRS